MKRTPQHSWHIFFLLCLLVWTPTAHAEDWGDWEEDEYPADVNIDNVYRSTCTPANALGVLGALPDVAETLKKDIFTRTNLLQTRYIGDLPIFVEFNTGRSFFSLVPFFNYTERMKFYGNDELISCYADLSDNIITLFAKSIPNFDGQRALDLFSRFKMREIRTGLMVQERKHWTQNFYTGFQLPLYYCIRHYNLTENERKELEEFLQPVILEMFGPCDNTPDIAIEKFAAGDAFGFGDLRFNTAWKLYEQDTFSFTLGARITMPTSGALKRGIVGGDFSHCGQRPFLNVEDPICNYLDSLGPPAQPEKLERAETEVATWAFNINNWISRNLLVPQLGLGRVPSIGTYIEPHFHINNQVTVYTRASCDYIFGDSSTRYVPVNRDLTNFCQDYLSENLIDEDEEAARRLLYLSEVLQEKMAPFQAAVTLAPRTQFEFIFAPTFRVSDVVLFQFGYDFWWLQKERFSSIDTAPTQAYHIIETGSDSFETIYDPQQLTYQTERALRGSSYQSKFFCNLDYRKFYNHSDITFSIGGDITLGSRGVGEDYTAKASIAWRF